jgi:ankyrin repeat protein
MKKSFLIITCLLSLSQILTAQQYADNVLLERDYWKTSPSQTEVEQKIAEGHDPVTPNKYAFDPICYAILEDASLPAIEYLLSLEGNEVDKHTHDGRNYLMWAAYKGNVSLMDLLLVKGSDAEIVDDHGCNLMTFAAVGGQKDSRVYQMILDNGGSIDDINREGANALLLLSSHLTKNDSDLLEYFLLKGMNSDHKDKEGNGMFNYAARLGNTYVMDMLVRQGKDDYMELNANNGNAMMFAARGWRGTTNDLAIFHYLDSLGIETNVLTKTGDTPLHALAFSNNDPLIFDFFIQKGIQINRANEDGNTAFFNAVRGQNNSIIEKILPLVESIDHQNVEGMSALLYTVRNRDVVLFNNLMQLGSDLTLADTEGHNLIYHAFSSYSENEKEAFDVFMQAAKERQLSIAPDKGGSNLAHLAIDKKSEYLLDQALALGAEINHLDKKGLSPLMLSAMTSENTILIERLIELGADISVLTEFGESAYDLAQENEFLSNEDLLFLTINKKN